MSFFFVKRGGEVACDDEFNFVKSKRVERQESGRELRVTDMPKSGVITHRALDDIKAEAQEKFGTAQFITSRNANMTLRETLQARRKSALERVSSARHKGVGTARPTLVVRSPI